jgi:hypothetical protein
LVHRSSLTAAWEYSGASTGPTATLMAVSAFASNTTTNTRPTFRSRRQIRNMCGAIRTRLCLSFGVGRGSTTFRTAYRAISAERKSKACCRRLSPNLPLPPPGKTFRRFQSEWPVLNLQVTQRNGPSSWAGKAGAISMPGKRSASLRQHLG